MPVFADRHERAASARRQQTTGEEQTMTTKSEIAQNALASATTQSSVANYPAIIEGFMARGISAANIQPRVNVFTYHAWRALGRQVRKGEHGVAIVTWITTEKDDPNLRPGEMSSQPARRRPKTAYVFHVSQTDGAVS
jgi:hypothetical protein